MKVLYLVGIYGFWIAPVLLIAGLVSWWVANGWIGGVFILLSVLALALRLVLSGINIQ